MNVEFSRKDSLDRIGFIDGSVGDQGETDQEALPIDRGRQPTMTEIVTLADIIDANLTELEEFNADSERKFESDWSRQYCFFLEKYVSGQEVEPDKVEDPVLKALLIVRNEIRSMHVQADHLKRLEAFQVEDDILKGEISFVLGLAYIKIEDNAKAHYYFSQSWECLKNQSTRRKALKSLHNKVVTAIRINPDCEREKEYELLFERAKECQDFAIMGTTLANLAWDRQRLGRFELALDLVNESLQHLEKFGHSINYHLTRLQKADIFCQMEQWKEAEHELDQVREAPFIEIQEAIKVIEYALGISSLPIDLSKLTPVWVQRFHFYTSIGQVDAEV